LRVVAARNDPVRILAAFGNLGGDGEPHHPLRRILVGYHVVVFRKLRAMQRKLIWSACPRRRSGKQRSADHHK